MHLFAANDYDPGDETPKVTHVSGKDLKVVSIALVIFIVICAPVYMGCKKQSEKHLCKQNMRGIGNAMNLYAEANNGLYCPVYAAVENDAPLVDKKGRAFTWVSLVSEYVGDRVSFKCPSASREENTLHQHRTDSDKEILCSYGMFTMRSTQATYAFRNQSTAVLIAETSNNGASDTYNPMPLAPGSQDGFLIGFNDDNFAFSKQTKVVTRLAFSGTKEGKFGSEASSRHDGGNFFLFADGHASPQAPLSAKVDLVGNQIDGFWATR